MARSRLAEPPLRSAGEDVPFSLVDLATALLAATRDPSAAGIARRAASGCLPRLGDQEPPWTVRGWLLPYFMDLWTTDGRWRYWLDTLEAGRLLGRPIPRLGFAASAPAAGQRALNGAAEIVREREGSSSASSRVVEWLAWGFAVGSAEAPRMGAETCEHLYRHPLDAMRREPADYLGWFLSEFGSRHDHKWTGFFPTPMGVTTLLAEINFTPGQDHRALTVMDPCVGTGAMLLAASNHSLRLCGQDINGTCVDATLVQGAMFAPWLSFPLPERLFPPREPQPDGEPEPEPGVRLQAGEVQGSLFT